MSINLQSLAPLTTAASTLSGLIVVKPQSEMPMMPQIEQSALVGLPLGPATQDPPSLLFQFVGEQVAMIRSEITDHYVEDNTALQNNIAFRPDTYTVHGFVGEVNNVQPKALQLLKAAADKLVLMGGYTPKLTTTALIAYNEAVFGYQVAANAAKAAVSAWENISSPLNFLTGQTNQVRIGSDGIAEEDFVLSSGDTPYAQNEQQRMFQQLYGYQKARILFTVTTPWCILEDMAIDSFRAIQEAESESMSDFEVTFKAIRTADVEELPASAVAGRLGAQGAGAQDLGTNQGSKSSASLSGSDLSVAGFA